MKVRFGIGMGGDERAGRAGRVGRGHPRARLRLHLAAGDPHPARARPGGGAGLAQRPPSPAEDRHDDAAARPAPRCAWPSSWPRSTSSRMALPGHLRARGSPRARTGRGRRPGAGAGRGHRAGSPARSGGCWKAKRSSGAILSPLPAQKEFSMWLGGNAPASLDRCGRLADGWLPSLLTPADAAAGWPSIDAAAEGAGREIDPEHFGVSIGYSRGPMPEATRPRWRPGPRAVTWRPSSPRAFPTCGRSWRATSRRASRSSCSDRAGRSTTGPRSSACWPAPSTTS